MAMNRDIYLVCNVSKDNVMVTKYFMSIRDEKPKLTFWKWSELKILPPLYGFKTAFICFISIILPFNYLIDIKLYM